MWKFRSKKVISPLNTSKPIDVESLVVTPLQQSRPFDVAYFVRDAVQQELENQDQDDLEACQEETEHRLRPSPRNPPRQTQESNLPPSNSNKQSYRNKKRALKRKRAVEDEGHASTERTLFEHVQLADPIRIGMTTTSLPVAAGAYSSIRLDEDEDTKQKEYGLDELFQDGFELVEWNGRDPVPLVDDEGRIFAVLAGRPLVDDYVQAAGRALETIIKAGGEEFSPGQSVHRRGNFPALAIGISYGGGQTVPKRLGTGNRSEIAKLLLEDKNIERLVLYADSAFAVWAPRIYRYYWEHMIPMEAKTGHVRNFSRSIFASLTVNFGPRVRTFKHRDHLNLPFGWCAIQALGKFDSKKGGHLILWDLRKVIEFPHSSTILIPSATLTHSNTAVAKDETRISMTQYTAGGIFRWVDNGFRTEETLKAQDLEEYRRMGKLKGERWKMGVKLFSTMEELLQRV